MLYRISLILLTLTCLFCFSVSSYAQEANIQENNNPVILYSGTPKKYEIGGIKVEGVKNYEDYVLIGLSGLSVGQVITVPGDDITSAVKRYWRHGLFSDVQILAEKIVDNKIYLKILLTQRPRIADIRYHGVKKSEREDLEAKLGLVKGSQITPNLIDRAKILIKKHFDEKGFKNAEVTIIERDLADNKEQVDVDVMIDKKEKVKVHQITIDGNTVLTDKKLKRVMKKTNEKNKLVNIFRSKKFIEEKYEEDKQLIIDKYNELGYRDAQIVVDSVTPYDDRTVDENDEEIIKILQEKKTIVLYSKTDLESAIDIEDLKSRINQPVIPISAKEETGITDLEEKIREMFFSGEIDFNDEVYITNERHRQELLKAQESLSLVENSIESGMPEDFYSIDLTDAYESLGRILGESLGEDLVNEIFSKFCMGK